MAKSAAKSDESSLNRAEPGLGLDERGDINPAVIRIVDIESSDGRCNGSPVLGSLIRISAGGGGNSGSLTGSQIVLFRNPRGSKILVRSHARNFE
jgi:hypothetical protein